MQYFLTAFASDGGVLVNETFECEEETAAVKHGKNRLLEENCEKLTHRMTRSGELILFHR